MYVVRLCAQKTIYMQFNKKFFNIVKVLFKSIERICRSGKKQIYSKAERVIDLGGLRKKYLLRCQIVRSKDYLYTVYQKVFFQYSEDLFQIN